MTPNPQDSSTTPTPPVKQKVALGFRSILDGAKKLSSPLFSPTSSSHGDGTAMATAKMTELFAVTDPKVDGEDCTHDCESCHVSYPRGFKIDEADVLYGHIKGWETHVLVATGKSDWVRNVEDEKGSVMQAFGKSEAKPSNGRLMLSASNMPTPGEHGSGCDYSLPTSVLLLPAFVLLDNVVPDTVPALVNDFIDKAPTNSSPLRSSPPRSLSPPGAVTARRCPHAALILLCSQKTRDARCGQSAPLLRKELERHLRPLGLYRDLDDERPGGVGIYFISHVGGHKYSANVMVYRRPDAFGLDGVPRGALAAGEELRPVVVARKGAPGKPAGGEESQGEGGEKVDGAGQQEEQEEEQDVGAAQCIWLARVKPEDCENLVKYTVLQGKVVKPGTQLRGGFDRSKGLLSW